MKNRPALIALILSLFLAGWGRGETVPAMVEIEARFYEVKAGQMPNLLPLPGPISGVDPLLDEAVGLSNAPAVLSVAGVFTSEQTDTRTKELESGRAKLLYRQKIVVLSGHRARMQNARALRYPSNFESSRTPEAEVIYPIAFEAKNVGFFWEVEPRIGQDGYTIDLIFSPRVVEFRGFIDATKIPKDASPEQIQKMLETPSKKGGVWQPVFRSREVSTQVTVYNGQTVVLGAPPTAETPGTVILLTAHILPQK